MNREQRAAQLWSVLALAAAERRVMTYELVGRITGLPPASIGDFLRPIQQYCVEKKLPPLTVLVVGKQDATPGEGFLAAADVPSAQLRVFEYCWTGMQAPSESELADAYTRAPDRR